MTTTSRIVLRAHTEFFRERKKYGKRNRSNPPKWPACALIFDCETRTDEKQSLTFGIYQVYACGKHGQYTDLSEEGIFYDSREVTAREADEINRFAADHRMCVHDREGFLRKIFLPLGIKGALIVGFNLPFDVSRIAADVRAARRLNDDWSFVMVDQPFIPRIVVTRKDGKIAFFRFSGVLWNKKKRKPVKVPRGRFLDVRTLAWSLRNVSYSLNGLCNELNIPGKLDHKPTGKVTPAEIKYARQDVRATIGALNVLRSEFDRYPIDLLPDRAYSPASIAKAYFKKMGIVPPPKKFHLPPDRQGIAAESFYGGRAEDRIRRTPLPVVHTDFKSEYPTAITLMGVWQLVIARRLEIADATSAVEKFLESATLDKMFNPESWRQLTCFALVQPDGDILPVRTAYASDSDENNVGVNVLTSDKPIWYALPDLVASTLLAGKPPKIIRAIRVVAKGQQDGLIPTTLGEKTIDPRTGDFFKTVIETRERIRGDMRVPESERKALGYFLKILANAGYGIFIETTPKLVAERVGVSVFSGETTFNTTSSVLEEQGPWYCPPIASLITSAGRLFLAMLECAVKELGGSYLFADTDSMSIVATKHGGDLPCGGGPRCLPDGQGAVKALSWAEVEQIAVRFNRLNPYDRETVPFILKIEDVNYENGVQREIEGFAISSKRYTFFVRTHRDINIITPSEHGLGHLFVPKSHFDEKQGARDWVIAIWYFIIRTALRIKCRKPKCFALPAMMKFAITTPNVLKALQTRQLKELLFYGDRIKPFNFILSPMLNRHVLGDKPGTNDVTLFGFPSFVDPEHFTLIAPFTEKVSDWYKMRWCNVHDGKQFYIAPLSEKQSFEASPYTLEDIVELYQIHPEAKSLAPDGTPCGWHTKGLLMRASVVASGFDYIGKETDRKWEQEGDINMLFPILPVYRPDESAQMAKASSIHHKAYSLSIRELAKRTGLSTRTVRAYRKGKRLRKTTIFKLKKAFNKLASEQLEEQEDLGLKSA